jgi:tetratricopeptide (TPR) repeat protein
MVEAVSSGRHHLSLHGAAPKGPPADAKALVKLGMALSERGEFASARADLDAAVALYTETDDYRPGDAYAARGTMFLAQRDFPKAIADYTTAIERQLDEPPIGPVRSLNRNAPIRCSCASASTRAAMMPSMIYPAPHALDPCPRTTIIPRTSVKECTQAQAGTIRKVHPSASSPGSVWRWHRLPSPHPLRPRFRVDIARRPRPLKRRRSHLQRSECQLLGSSISRALNSSIVDANPRSICHVKADANSPATTAARTSHHELNQQRNHHTVPHLTPCHMLLA